MTDAPLVRRFRWSPTVGSALALGLSRVGSFTASAEPRAMADVLAMAFDLGINTFDTADIYGQGASERLLGKVFRRTRERIVICTKVGFRLSSKARIAAALKPLIKPMLRPVLRRSSGVSQAMLRARGSEISQDFSPAHIVGALEASLRRLRTDHVDLLLLHSPPTSLEPDPVIAALQRAVKDGKIAAFGVSCRAPEDIDTFLAWSGLSALQLRMAPGAMPRALRTARRKGIGLIAREVFSASRSLVESGVDIREALRPALSETSVDTVVFGTSSAAHLRSDVEAAVGILGGEK